MKDIQKIGPVELYREEAERYFQEGKYLVTWRKVWQIFYSQANDFYYGQCVYRIFEGNMAKRGRFHAMSGAEVNKLIGHNLLR